MMENKDEHADVIELIEKVFSFIEGNKLTEDSLNILNKELKEQPGNNVLLQKFIKNKFNKKQYPKLNFTIGYDKEGNKVPSEIHSLESISDKNIKKLTEHVEKSNDAF